MASPPTGLPSQNSSRLARTGLLWLALLLAFAQTLVLCHGYTHAPAESVAAGAGKHSGGLAHCQSCIVAAAIGGGAPPSSPLPLVECGPGPLLVSCSVAGHDAPQHRAYAIRAPPFLAS